jgi:hypothetical protein
VTTVGFNSIFDREDGLRGWVGQARLVRLIRHSSEEGMMRQDAIDADVVS